MLEKRNLFMLMGSNKDIAHIIFKKSVIEDMDEYKNYSSSLRSITKFNLIQETKNAIVELDSLDQLESALLSVKQQGFRIANIWFEGNWPSSDWDSKLLNEVSKWDSEDTDWLCAGHILARKNRVPEFHNQCIVINLKNHRILFMNSGKNNGTDYPNFGMSDQHLHDDYTPMFLDGSRDDISVDDEFPEFSTNLKEEHFDIFTYPIAVSLLHNLKVHNFDYDLRDCKTTCYPEDDQDEGEHILFNILNPDNMKSHEHTWVADLLYCKENYIEEDKLEFFEEVTDPRFQIFSMSHDSTAPGYRNSVGERDIDLDVDIMILPCRNFSNFNLVSENTKCENVLWYDYMTEFLEWQKKVIEEWDGTDYIAFHETNYNDIKDIGNTIYYHDNLDMICEDHENKQLNVPIETIENVRSKNNSYENMDISVISFSKNLPFHLSESDELTHSKNIYIDVGAMFIMPHTTSIVSSGASVHKAFYDLITSLENKFNNVIITGYNPNGTYHEYLNTRFI